MIQDQGDCSAFPLLGAGLDSEVLVKYMIIDKNQICK
jgi:hypothetical protein